MGRAEGLIAIGIAWQLLVLTLVIDGAFTTQGAGIWLSAIGFIIVAIGAWMTAWSKTIES